MSSAQVSVALRRRGFTSRRLLVAVALVLGVPAAGWSLWPGRTAADAPPTMHEVERSEFIHDLTEQGTVESEKDESKEVQCQVKNNGMSGTTVLDVIPEGTFVKEGDWLATLDASGLENDRMKQQIAVNTSQAALITAETTVKTAEIARKEYLDGSYKELKEAAEGEVFVAEENLRRAEQYAIYSEKLAKKGYLTPLQLEADRFAVEKAHKDLDAAKTKLSVLENFTKVKSLTELDGAIATARANLAAQQSSNELECKKLALILDQIDKCTIRAPCDGQVVYVNTIPAWSDKPLVIEPGVTVRERQVILKLPDRSKVLVKARINESKIALVTEGMPATIRLDALPDVELPGMVRKVEEYPSPTNRYTSSAKEYETTIEVHKADPRLRSGLTAEVKIHVERFPDAVQVPVQAILEHGDKHYCFLYDEQGGFQLHEVKLGCSNDKFVVIREGLAAGDQVVRNPAAYRDKVALPELPKEEVSPPLLAKAGKRSAEKRSAPEVRRPGREDNVRETNPIAVVARLMSQIDKDHDGQVKLDEVPKSVPETVRAWLAAADANHDGTLDRDELIAAAARSLPPAMAVKPPAGGRP
jgi:HlyD family secretion protein